MYNWGWQCHNIGQSVSILSKSNDDTVQQAECKQISGPSKSISVGSVLVWDSGISGDSTKSYRENP